MFENSVPGLPEAAAKEDLTPLAYMRKYGVFKVSDKSYSRAHERPLSEAELNGGVFTQDGTTVLRDGACAGVVANGVACADFNTPSRRLEFYSPTLAAWSWPEHAIPRYVPGHVYWRDLKREEGEFDLLPNFRLPTLVHTRSAVKWLYEISHTNPLWISTEDATRAWQKEQNSYLSRTRQSQVPPMRPSSLALSQSSKSSRLRRHLLFARSRSAAGMSRRAMCFPYQTRRLLSALRTIP